MKITEYVESLPKKLQKQGAELAKGVQAKLDTLDQDVDSKKDAMIDKVANRYRDSKAAVDARVEEMKAENMGLWDRAKAAIAGVIQTIIELKNALASALRKASNAIVGIIKDPIGFLNNLIQAFKHGLEMYLGRIKTHLLGGVIKWLTGAMGDLDIKVPAKFDLRGIVDLVLQVLGITWDNIRAQIVRRLGPAGAKVIGRVEQGVGLIAKMLSEGPIALWSLIVGRVTGLWDMVVGKIQSFIEDTIIMQGIQWLMGLINPAAAFVKACKMIIDGVMWLWNNAKRIVQLIDTIAGSAFSIAKGAIGTAAGAIERVLGRLTPILISFLASLLGLNGAVSRVKEIISAVRKPVTCVIGKVVDKGVQFGRKLLKTPLGKKVAGGLKKAKAWGKKQVDTAKRLGDRAVQKVKKRVYGGDDTFEGRQERLRLAMTSAVRAVNAYAGKKVRRLTLDPQLKAIKVRRGIGYLDVVPVGEFWHVEGRVDRSMATDARNDGSTTGDSPEQGPLSGHAQRGGQVIVGLTGPYSRIGSGKVKDDRDFKGANGSTPDYLRVIAEHVLPRQAVDRIARAMGFVGAPRGGKWDRAAETVLIYKGAADMKTTELDPDTEKDTRAIAATMRNRESTPQQRSSAHQDLRRLLERHTQGSIANTAYVVAQEDRKHRPQRGNNDILPSSGTISAVGMAELDQATLHIVGGAELDRDATGVSETESPLAAATRALAVAMGEDDRINKPGEVTELGPNRVEVKYYGSPRLVIDFRVKGRGITWRIRTSADKTRLDSGKVGAGTRGHVLGRIAQERAKAAAASTNDPKLETATLAEINSWDSVGLRQYPRGRSEDRPRDPGLPCAARWPLRHGGPGRAGEGCRPGDQGPHHGLTEIPSSVSSRRRRRSMNAGIAVTRLGYHRIIGVKRKGSIRGRSGGRPSQVAPCTPTVGTPTGQLLQLQRTVGNRAVARAITSASTVHWPPSGAGVEPRHVPPPTAKFRLPSFAELEKSYKSATLAIPESVIKNRVGVLLGRLAREKKLTSKDPVKDIVARIFPGGGKIDKAAFEAAVDVADRALIYGTVLDAEIKVKAADKAKLVKAFDESAKLADKVKSDKKGLKQVFGSKHADAKANYGKAASALRDTARNLDARVTTDYNLDDPQVGLGGWADFGSRHMHLTLDVAKVADKASTKITLVHEGAHHRRVVDRRSGLLRHGQLRGPRRGHQDRERSALRGASEAAYWGRASSRASISNRACSRAAPHPRMRTTCGDQQARPLGRRGIVRSTSTDSSATFARKCSRAIQPTSSRTSRTSS